MAWAKGLRGFFRKSIGQRAKGPLKAGLEGARRGIGGAVGRAKDRMGWEATRRIGANVLAQGAFGGGLAAATGNEDYLYMGLGMGAVGGAASMFRGSGAAKLFMTGKMFAGQTIAGFTGNPKHAPIGALAWAGATAAFKPQGMIMQSLAGGAKHTPGYMLNAARVPFAPKAAFKYLARTPYPTATPFVAGVLGGAGWSAAKLASSTPAASTEGVFPGGVGYAGPSGRVMGYNHLDTAGLTLALHRNNKSGRIV